MRNFTYLLLISVILLAACAPKTFTEKDLANVKLTEKDLPAGFVQSPDSAIEDITPFMSIVKNAFFNTAATGKIINATMFSKDASDASYGILSFNYFPLSEAEKQQVLTETKKQGIATCCKMMINILQGNETSCAQSEFASMFAVISGLDKIAEASLGCSLTISGNAYFELGYAINQNAISVIFEGYSQFHQGDKITPLLDVKTMLPLMNGRLSTVAK
jgi:hypothetical protein